jgi:hypothetical protein
MFAAIYSMDAEASSADAACSSAHREADWDVELSCSAPALMEFARNHVNHICLPRLFHREFSYNGLRLVGWN